MENRYSGTELQQGYVVGFTYFTPLFPPSRGGTFGRAGLQQSPRPFKGDVQSDKIDHDWVRGFGGGIVELLNC